MPTRGASGGILTKLRMQRTNFGKVGWQYLMTCQALYRWFSARCDGNKMDLSENRGPKNLMLSHQLFPIKLVQCSSWLCGSSPFSDILLWEIHEIVNLLGLSDNASQSKRAIVHMLQRDFDFGGAWLPLFSFVAQKLIKQPQRSVSCPWNMKG